MKNRRYRRWGFSMENRRDRRKTGVATQRRQGSVPSVLTAAFLDGLCDCYIPVIVEYAVEKNTIFETYTYRIPE